MPSSPSPSAGGDEPNPFQQIDTLKNELRRLQQIIELPEVDERAWKHQTLGHLQAIDACSKMAFAEIRAIHLELSDGAGSLANALEGMKAGLKDSPLGGILGGILGAVRAEVEEEEPGEAVDVPLIE